MGHWSLGLIKSLEDPEFRIKEDDYVIVIKDKFPKARFHYLVVPKKNILKLTSVCKEDLKLLEHMHVIALKLQDQHINHEFKIGYHAVPSMQRLHLHVISTDFDSSYLKRKEHWNSFTTPFFLNSSDVIGKLKDTGEIKYKKEDYLHYLKNPLACHKCSYNASNLPTLKKHINEHIVN